MGLPAIAETASRRLAAVHLLNALERPQSWFHRRRETLTFVDAGHVSRTVEVEFSIPPLEGPPVTEILIPVVLIPRDGTRVLALRNATGERLPALTGGEAALLTTAAIALAAELRLGEEPDPELATLLRTPGAFSAGRTTRMATDEAERQYASLRSDASFLHLMAMLAGAEPVLVPVTVEGATRRLFTIEYEVALLETGPPWRRLTQSLGWKETTMLVDVPDISLGTAYEFEFQVPDDLELTHATLLLLGEDEAARSVAGAEPGTAAGQYRRLTVRDVAPRTRAAALLSLRVARAYPATVLLAALFVALVLTAGLLRLHQLVDATDAAAAILLGVPTLFIALIADPARRSPAVKLVTIARGVLLLSGLLTYVAATALVMSPRATGRSVDATLDGIWRGATYAAWSLVALQAIGVVGPLVQARRRRRG